jgi:hypothetical protein
MLKNTFIVNQSSLRETLADFIHPDDIPEIYGGNMKWIPGQTDVDHVLLSEIEKDGRTGWVDGPCLWRNGKRVPVGTVNGVKR